MLERRNIKVQGVQSKSGSFQPSAPRCNFLSSCIKLKIWDTYYGKLILIKWTKIWITIFLNFMLHKIKKTPNLNVRCCRRGPSSHHRIAVLGEVRTESGLGRARLGLSLLQPPLNLKAIQQLLKQSCHELSFRRQIKGEYKSQFWRHFNLDLRQLFLST